jgi:hypothetical protein
MKKVICLYNGITASNTDGIRLTIGKIYDVTRIIGDRNSPVGIEIIDNVGTIGTYVLEDTTGKRWFEDATSYIREDKLNDILNG